MAIETEFRFSQVRDAALIERLELGTADLLGALRAFVGDNHYRTWSGPGFNLIWRPHRKAGPDDPNERDFFLELDVTSETLSFTDITGSTGIANRGLLQGDVVLGGLAYQQEVNDVTRVPRKPLHFEPGVWVRVPPTTDPLEQPPEGQDLVARMGSIPHGTTVNAQGVALSSPDGRPHFTPVSIMPFKIGSKDDGVDGIVVFEEGRPPVAKEFTSRTTLADAVGLTDEHFSDLSKILSDVTDGQKILSTKVFIVATEPVGTADSQSFDPRLPREGGGTGNMAFLVGAANGPNAVADRMTAIFWIEEVEGVDGRSFLQLQYIQRVLLNFNGLSWPHVSLATMIVTEERQ